jgi:hypothetical protein
MRWVAPTENVEVRRRLPGQVGQWNRSQIVTGSQKHRDPRFRPWVFTEHGALMAANVLRSNRAVQIRIRRDSRTHVTD